MKKLVMLFVFAVLIVAKTYSQEWTYLATYDNKIEIYMRWAKDEEHKAIFKLKNITELSLVIKSCTVHFEGDPEDVFRTVCDERNLGSGGYVVDFTYPKGKGKHDVDRYKIVFK